MVAKSRVALYCATFLKPEMLHIYRQICAIQRLEKTVFTQKREGADRFPFDDVVELPRSPWRWLNRVINKQLLDRPMLRTMRETSQLRGEFEERGCSLLHLFFGNVAVQLLPTLRDPRRSWPVVVSFHGADVLVELDRPAHLAATREVFGRATLILARSQSLVEVLAQQGCPREKIRLNRTGIPLDGFPYVRRMDPAGKFHLFQACRLIEKKGLPTTLRAFARFAQAFPESRLTVAGEGPLEASLRHLAMSLGVADRVTFAGFLDQDALRRALYASHFFLHPSETGRDGNQEGVPNSLLEAMATGLPVFATTHGGIPEAVAHGVSGWLVPEGDGEALGRALVEWAEAPERLAAMGEAAARSVAENFELHAQARKLEDCYFEALATAH